MTESREIEIQTEKVKIFLKGEYKDSDKQAVAIVGSRNAFPMGKEIAYKFAYDLSKHGITIVSGLARGIDTSAHLGALDAGGRTIAILGHGLDIVYPAENIFLAERITKSGCLMTKFKDGTPPLGKNFLARNQIIAGLSKVALVVEGEIRSGSISTANHAANLGIEVFAIPGSPATNFLIENGASVANSPEDILTYLSSIS